MIIGQKLVAKSDSVVKNTKSESEMAARRLGLGKMEGDFIVVIVDVFGIAIWHCDSFRVAICIGADNLQIGAEGLFTVEEKAELRVLDDFNIFMVNFIRNEAASNFEKTADFLVWRSNFASKSRGTLGIW